MYIAVVINPHSRKNRGLGSTRMTAIARALGPYGEVIQTSDLDALDATVSRLFGRVTHWVVDGGDGALHQLLNRLRQHLTDEVIASDVAFIPANGGTINFAAHKAGIRDRTEVIVRRLVAEVALGRKLPETQVDSLRIEVTVRIDDNITSNDFLGFAVAAGGVGQRFFDLFYRLEQKDPKRIVYVIGRAVLELGLRPWPGLRHWNAGYAEHLFCPTPAEVVIDGKCLPAQAFTALHAGAFDINLGGVIRVFPWAKEPGVLHFQAGSLSPGGLVKHLPDVVRGRKLHNDALFDAPGRVMEIYARNELLTPIVDGERYVHVTTMRISAGPSLRIVVV